MTKNERHCPFCDGIIKERHNKYCSITCSANDRHKQKNKETHDRMINGGYINPRAIKNYLIDTRGVKCQICKRTTWMKHPIPLILDHVDGNHTNNKLENLRLVCGNCDMQLPTYKGKNFGNGRYSRKMRYREGKSY